MRSRPPRKASPASAVIILQHWRLIGVRKGASERAGVFRSCPEALFATGALRRGMLGNDMIRPTLALLLAGTALLTSPAMAQQAAAPADQQAQLEQLQQQVIELQKQIDALKAATVKTTPQTTPSWSGAPRLEDKEAGWSFKPRGRLMLDSGYVANPNDAVATRNLGFATRVRRIRLGAEGTIPGGFGYKFEMDFANANVGFADVVVTYAPKNRPFDVTLGNFETLNSLEQITSSRFISFLERSAFNEAFINTRRLGVAVGLKNKPGDLRGSVGLFAAHSIDSTLDNDGWIAASRLVYSPKLGDQQLHFGVNAQHRDFASNNNGAPTSGAGSPSNGQLARYRARPFTQLTDVRFVDTGNFAAKSDTLVGIEAAGIVGPFHVTGEAQWTRVNAYAPGTRFSDPLDFFGAEPVTPSGDPTFFGGYVEAGYYLTGESRGYRDGLWNRTKVLKPFSKGGWGALQLNGRVEYLDLDSGKLKRAFANNFVSGVATPSTNLSRGGQQLGLLTSLIWIPEDYFRLYLQYSYARITGGPLAGTVKPLSTAPLDERSYAVDSVQARASFDF